MRLLDIIAVIVYMGLAVGVVILYQILKRLDRILDLLLRSLPLHAIALVPPEDEPAETSNEKRPAIQGFRQRTGGAPAGNPSDPNGQSRGL